MRIVYLHQYFNTPSMRGGSRSYEMARRWAAAGHDVHVVTSLRTNDRSPAPADVDGVRVHWHRVPYGNEMGYLRRLMAFGRFALTAARTARRLKGDVLFASSTPLTVIVPALYAATLRRTPIVFEVRDLWPEVPIAMGALRNPALRAAARWLERIAYRRSRAVIALSDGMAEGVRRVAPDATPVIVAPNACDLELFDVPAEVGAEFRRRNPWIGDRHLVVYCGTLGRVNDVGYLARLADEVSRRTDRVAFAVFGTGAERERVRTLATELGVIDRTFFLRDPVAKSELPAILSAADLAVSVVRPVQALEQNSANKFFDTLAASRPIAVNHGGWQADLIREEGIGVVLDQHDLAAAADEVAAFFALPRGERTLMGERAGSLGRKRFARDVIASQVLRAIEGAHESHQRGARS